MTKSLLKFRPQAELLAIKLRNVFYSQRQRAKYWNRSLDYTLDDLKKFVGGCSMLGSCPYCEELLTIATLSLDHKFCVSKGGSFAMSNLVKCCARCNGAKGTLAHDEFVKLMKFLRMELSPVTKDDIIGRLRAGAAIRCGGWRPKRYRARRKPLT